MLAVKFQQHLISPLVLLPHLLILQIATSGHPAVDLVAESFDVIFYGQALAEFLDGVGVFIARGEHAEGDFYLLGVGGIDHCRVDFGDGGEGGAGLGGQGDNLLRYNPMSISSSTARSLKKSWE